MLLELDNLAADQNFKRLRNEKNKTIAAEQNFKKAQEKNKFLGGCQSCCRANF